ncbi:hypothetical protein L6R52_10830 [Myxococcota bacterium]|nr:hypothetical protein [Myxococcota bacterium]
MTEFMSQNLSVPIWVNIVSQDRPRVTRAHAVEMGTTIPIVLVIMGAEEDFDREWVKPPIEKRETRRSTSQLGRSAAYGSTIVRRVGHGYGRQRDKSHASLEPGILGVCE